MSINEIAKELIVDLEEDIIDKYGDMDKYMAELTDGLLEYQKEYGLTMEELYTRVCWTEDSTTIFSYVFG